MFSRTHETSASSPELSIDPSHAKDNVMSIWMLSKDLSKRHRSWIVSRKSAYDSSRQALNVDRRTIQTQIFLASEWDLRTVISSAR